MSLRFKNKTKLFTNTDKPKGKSKSEVTRKKATMTEDWEKKPHRSFLRCMTEHTHVHTCRMRRHIHQLCYCFFSTNWKWKYQLISFNLRRDEQHLYRETLLRATENSNTRTCYLHSMHKITDFPNINLQMPCNTYQNQAGFSHEFTNSFQHLQVHTKGLESPFQS